jgi:hypothetical protein
MIVHDEKINMGQNQVGEYENIVFRQLVGGKLTRQNVIVSVVDGQLFLF